MTTDLGIVAFTLRCALVAMLFAVPLGIAFAWLLARREWRGKSLVETLIALPIVLPPVATGLLLLILFGRRGPLGGLHVIFTWKAVVIAMAVMSLPLFVRSARDALDGVAARYENVARTLGANERRVFFTITLPLARRGIAGGTVLAFARALGEFGATIVIAGNIPGRTTTLALAIYDRVQLGSDTDALRLVAISALLAFVALFTSERLRRRA